MSKTSGKAFFWTLLGFVVVGGGAFIYFQYIRKPKTDSTDTGSTTSGEVGKNAYATRPDTKVFNNDMTVYKVANEGEWLGTIKSVVTKAGYKYYQSTGDKFFVAMGTQLK